MRHLLNRDTARQVLRYGVVGVVTNSVGYSIYLFVVWLGVDPKMAVTLLYPVGVTISYFGNARYSFNYHGGVLGGGGRFLIAHALGYGTNIFLLYFLHDKLHYPHQLVQILAILVVAGLLFLLFKYFVFAQRAEKRS